MDDTDEYRIVTDMVALKERTLKEVRERCLADPTKTAKKLGLA